MMSLSGRLNFRPWKLWLLFLIFIIGALLIWQSQLPAHGKTEILSSTEVSERVKELPEESERTKALQEVRKTMDGDPEKTRGVGVALFEGKHFFFQYPNSYEVRTNEATGSGTLEKIILLGIGELPKKIVITVAETQESSLSEISAVQARRLKPNIYTEEALAVAGEKGVVFAKTEKGFERVAFFLKNRLLITIALSSAFLREDLENDFSNIIQSLRWK